MKVFTILQEILDKLPTDKNQTFTNYFFSMKIRTVNINNLFIKFYKIL